MKYTAITWLLMLPVYFKDISQQQMQLGISVVTFYLFWNIVFALSQYEMLKFLFNYLWKFDNLLIYM